MPSLPSAIRRAAVGLAASFAALPSEFRVASAEDEGLPELPWTAQNDDTAETQPDQSTTVADPLPWTAQNNETAVTQPDQSAVVDPPEAPPPSSSIVATIVPATPTDVINEVVPPTKSPTTLEPTPQPTLEPAPQPSLEPSSSPSESPSASSGPTPDPSPRPSASASPTWSPSLAPSYTRPPSYAPSDSIAPTSEGRHEGLRITLEGIRAIEDLSDWEEFTADFYERVYNGDGGGNGGVGGAAMVEDASVKIRLTNQNTISGDVGGRRRTRHHRRTLQQKPAATSVAVTYAQATAYRSLDPDLSADEMPRFPLSTEDRREEYVEGLRRTLEGYEDLTAVSSISTPYVEYGKDGAIGGTTDAGGGLSTVHIVGIACGGAAFLLLVGGLVFYRRRSGKDDITSHACGEHPASSGAAPAPTASADDTRYFVEVGSHSDSPERSAAGTAVVTPSDLGDMSVASHFHRDLDDDAAEELLTVYAPAGKLGVVIDSPDEGAPVIHDVKGTSPVSGEVRAGDRLVAVDDRDVRTMTAIGVSRLISGRSSRPRKLVVIRRHDGISN